MFITKKEYFLHVTFTVVIIVPRQQPLLDSIITITCWKEPPIAIQEDIIMAIITNSSTTTLGEVEVTCFKLPHLRYKHQLLLPCHPQRLVDQTLLVFCQASNSSILYLVFPTHIRFPTVLLVVQEMMTLLRLIQTILIFVLQMLLGMRFFCLEEGKAHHLHRWLHQQRVPLLYSLLQLMNVL